VLIIRMAPTIEASSHMSAFGGKADKICSI